MEMTKGHDDGFHGDGGRQGYEIDCSSFEDDLDLTSGRLELREVV